MVKAVVIAPVLFIYSSRATDDVAAACCQDETAECKACDAGVSVQKYCVDHGDTEGCNSQGSVSVACCQDESANCKACRAGVDVQKYCADHRDTEGCDDICCDLGCSSLCQMQDAGQLYSTKHCPYWVDDTTADAWVPVILEAEIESNCPILEYGDQNLGMCEQCAKLHKPCSDTYMACGGCKCSKWHEAMNFNVKTSHTCEEIQNYFKTKNSATVKCKDASMDEPDPDNSDKMNFIVHEKTEEERAKLLEGFVTTDCKSDVKCLECDKMPYKLEFKCDECKTKGVPLLLKKCCDVCKKWVDGLANDSSIPANIKAYGWCSGCDVDEIKSHKTGLMLPWPHAHLYEEYTEDHADAGMAKHVDENICQLLSPKCGEEEPEHEGGPPPDEEGFIPTPGGCLHQNGQCRTGGGRRLENEDSNHTRFLAASSGVSEAQEPRSDPDITCEEFDPTFYTTDGGTEATVAPGIAEPEQNAATTFPGPTDANSAHKRTVLAASSVSVVAYLTATTC